MMKFQLLLSRLLLLCLLLAQPSSTSAFIVAVPTSTTNHQRRVSAVQWLKPSSNEDNDKPPSASTGYNDDAFGLVFLSALTLEQDAIFSTIFAACSFAASIAVQQGITPYRYGLPGAVAIATLLGTTVVSGAVPSNIELGACAVSIVWSVFQEVREKEE